MDANGLQKGSCARGPSSNAVPEPRLITACVTGSSVLVCFLGSYWLSRLEPGSDQREFLGVRWNVLISGNQYRQLRVTFFMMNIQASTLVTLCIRAGHMLMEERNAATYYSFSRLDDRVSLVRFTCACGVLRGAAALLRSSHLDLRD